MSRTCVRIIINQCANQTQQGFRCLFESGSSEILEDSSLPCWKSDPPKTNASFWQAKSKHQLLHLSKFAPSKVQIAHRLHLPSANGTWVCRLMVQIWPGANRCPSKPLTEPPQTCVAQPPQKPEVEPLKTHPRRAKRIALGRFLNPGRFFWLG